MDKVTKMTSEEGATCTKAGDRESSGQKVPKWIPEGFGKRSDDEEGEDAASERESLLSNMAVQPRVLGE